MRRSSRAISSIGMSPAAFRARMLEGLGECPETKRRKRANFANTYSFAVVKRFKMHVELIGF